MMVIRCPFRPVRLFRKCYMVGFCPLLKNFTAKGICYNRYLAVCVSSLSPIALSWSNMFPYAQYCPALSCTSSQYRSGIRFYSKAKKTNKDKKNKNVEEVGELEEDFHDEEEEEEEEEEDTTEVLQELREKTGLEEGHSVLVIQPDFKWGRNRFHLESIDHMLGEALGLVESLKDWKVLEARTESIRKPDGKYFFGKGKLEELTKHVNELRLESKGGLTAVFVDVGRLSRRQHVELEDLWGVKVFDRFSLVLQIFKERATTSEAKVQVELAELGYIRSRLVFDPEHSSYDQQRGGTHSIGGAGETHLQVAKRTLSLRQQRLRKKLESIRKRRSLIRHDRVRRKLPIVAVVGYTNAGKTTLIKALTHDVEMNPEDKLFATLDVTAHRGKLPCGMSALFIDTVGFVSDLPHELLESFSATLEDIVHSDLLIHVRDCSHPEFEAQKVHVLDVLKLLKLPKYLMENIVEVHNKVDVRDSGVKRQGANMDFCEVSALHETGLDNLRLQVEESLLKTTGRQVKSIVIPQSGPQLSWLHHEATVSETETTSDGRLLVKVIMDEATLGRYSAKFGKID